LPFRVGDVFEVKLQRFFVVGDGVDPFQNVDGQARKAFLVEVDFLVVRHLAEIAVGDFVSLKSDYKNPERAERAMNTGQVMKRPPKCNRYINCTAYVLRRYKEVYPLRRYGA